MHTSKSMLFLVLACAMMLSFGCAKSVVPLTYSATTDEVVPIAGAPTICVVSFTDDRTESNIGLRSDKSAFTSDIAVAEWMAQALAIELGRLGYVVTTAPTLAVAKRSGASYVVLGAVNEVWLLEKNPTSYDCTMRSTITLRKGESVLMKSPFNATLSRIDIAFSSIPQRMLTDTLRDLTQTITWGLRTKLSS